MGENGLFSNILSSFSGGGNNFGWSTRTPMPGTNINQGLNTSMVSALANQGNKPGFFQTLGNQFAQGGTMSNLLGGVAQIGGLVGGISDFINNRKFLKSNLESMALQREIARENLAMQRAEYDRLKRNRAAITKAYGG